MPVKQFYLDLTKDHLSFLRYFWTKKDSPDNSSENTTESISIDELFSQNALQKGRSMSLSSGLCPKF